MKALATGLLLVLATLVQVTWAPKLAVLGAFPNVVLVLAVAIAWTRGQRAGLACACAGGLLLDATAPGPLGPHALALLVGAYVAGSWGGSVERWTVAQPVLATALATAIYCGVLVGMDELLGLAEPEPAVAVQLAGAAALYNALLAVPAILVLRTPAREVTA